jgi:hypothetical protein
MKPQRILWTISPHARIKDNAKLYDRKKDRKVPYDNTDGNSTNLGDRRNGEPRRR